MNFTLRALRGLALLVLTLAIVGLGAKRLLDAGGDAQERRRPPPAERQYVVNVIELQAVSVRPQLTAYGEVRSWRTVELRSPSAGRLVQVATRFRDGADVSAGTVLATIDPADSQARRGDAQAAVAEAEAEVAEAREAVLAAEQELQAAERQTALREQSLERQRALLAKGFAARTEIETAELSLASAEQTVLNRSQIAISARKRVERSMLKLQRARITVDDAERLVGDTRLDAPFDGTLTAVSAVMGRLVSVNEKLGELVDRQALEVVFRVSNRQFANLLDDAGRLQPLSLQATLKLGERSISVPGVIDRVDAVVGAGQSGRLLFARLQAGPDVVLRPGDFVSVTVQENVLSNVARIPATAADMDGALLVLDEQNRLHEIRAKVERRQGDELIVSGVEFGARIVAERLPQLGPGISVRPREASTTATEPAPPPPDTIELDPERRKRLIAAISGARRLPEERKQRLLEMLEQPRVPTRLVERIEARMRGARGS